jgi:amino acid transporter
LSAAHLVFPLSIVIAVLLGIVALSYTQVVRAYETSGGAYVVAKDNFGTVPSLVAGAALLVDYVLPVSVSVASGVLAITSVFPSLASWTVRLSVLAIVLITFVNLRGVRESGITFALPTYGFIISMLALIGVGLVKTVTGSPPHAIVPHPIPASVGAVGAFVLLRAFASGSSALTGVEAIANGVTAFRRPQSSNAAKTLLMMAAVAITLFLGVSYLAVQMHARPSSTVSVLSEIANATFPSSSAAHFMFWVVQVFTFAILILAANTSYQGFPRLAAIMARDGFFPRQFSNLGDRLVFSNGIVVLATIATALILIFSANVNSLIHLYVLGVFTAFTLSQAGMVRHWFRLREPGWRRSALINGIGGVATALVGVIVIVTKFTEGAWAVVVAIPLLVFLFLGIHRHYAVVERRLRRGATAALTQPVRNQTVLLYVERLDPATRTALWYAQTIATGDLRAIHVPFEGSDPGIKARFFRIANGNPHLEVLPAEEDRIDAVLDYVWGLPHGGRQPDHNRHPGTLSATVIARRVPAPHDLLAQTAAPLRTRPRSHRRPARHRRQGSPVARAETRRLHRPRLRRHRRLTTSRPLRTNTPVTRHARPLHRPRPRRRRPNEIRLGTPQNHHATPDHRSNPPRPRPTTAHPATQDHRRPRSNRRRRHARTRRPRRRPTTPQPTRALPQTPPPLRTPSHPRQRPLPTPLTTHAQPHARSTLVGDVFVVDLGYSARGGGPYG